MNMQRISFGNYLTTSYYPSSVENPNLRWERSQQVNIGLDIGLLNNRVYLEVDHYRAKSDGLLLDVPVPGISGFTSVFTNIGELQNRGVELNLTTHNLDGALKWTTQLTSAANRNKVTKLGIDDAPIIFNPGENIQAINQVGHPLFSFFGYIYEGSYLNQEAIAAGPQYPYTVHPGYGRYADLDNNGVINANDRTIIGNNQPDFIWAFTNSFRFRNFDFSIMWHGVVGNDVYDANIRRSMIGNQGGRNYYKLKNNRWRSESEPGDGYHFKLTSDIQGFDTQPSTYWIEDGSFTRIKDITLGYTLPTAFTQRLGVSKARFYFNGINLLTFQKSELLVDPENFSGSDRTQVTDAFRRGVSHSPYPTSKIMSLGVNIEL
jgi:TonB-dependent starch-binding outer membrane protein SusC